MSLVAPGWEPGTRDTSVLGTGTRWVCALISSAKAPAAARRHCGFVLGQPLCLSLSPKVPPQRHVQGLRREGAGPWRGGEPRERQW